MATLINNSISLVKFLMSSSILLIILLSCFMKKSYGAIGSHYHTVEISSLLPDSICTNKGSHKKQSTLEVFHQYGPCSPQGQDHNSSGTPSLSQILSYDQVRVDYIQTKLNPNKLNDRKVNLPAQSGQSLGSGNYIVNIGLGTPPDTLSLAFDTGSDLTWTQCQPCIRSCYQQHDPIFNPSTSSTYSNISCSSPQCSQLTSGTKNSPGCIENTCIYDIRYGDHSFSVGFFAKDKLTLTSTDVFPSFLFGCGQYNQGLFGSTAGLLGLGRDPVSIVSQTAQKYGKYFSYCLPSTSSSTGHLTLGKNQTSSNVNVNFTPFADSRGTTFYFIDILSISVGGTQLSIPQSVFNTSGSIIDSGTVITRLPPTAYSMMRTVFRKMMAKYPRAQVSSLFDTCYDLSGYTTVNVPNIMFKLGGNVIVDLAPSGILYAVDSSTVCLAFAGNNYTSDITIFGNTQQKTFEVVYDVAGGRLGFGPAGCK